jgi:ribosomal protein L40E
VRATQADVLNWLALCRQGRGAKPFALEVPVATRICRDCGNISPADLSNCPACGSSAWAVPPGQRFLFGV